MRPFLLAETQECVSTYILYYIYYNVRARVSLEEVQPSKVSGGMMRHCIRLGWLKPVRGVFFAKIREKSDSAKIFKEKVDNDTSRKVSAPLGKAYLKEIT